MYRQASAGRWHLATRVRATNEVPDAARDRPTNVESVWPRHAPYPVTGASGAYDRHGMNERLVTRAQAGDEEAFAELTMILVDRFHGLARTMLRDPGLAEDAVQGALVRVWQDLPRLRESDRFEAWAYRLLVNACYTEARRARRWLPGVLGRALVDTTVPDGTGGVADRDELERGFRRLPMDQRAVVALHHYLGFTLAETATVLDIAEGTVRSRLYRAMETLRAALAADARTPAPIARPKEIER